MLVRLVRADKDNKETTSKTYHCEHISCVEKDDGIDIELSPSGDTFSMPSDGNTMFLMNDGGDTFDCKRWPPRKVDKAVFHTGEAETGQKVGTV